MSIFHPLLPVFIGGRQPYAPREKQPVVAAAPVNNPPFADYNQPQYSTVLSWWAPPDPSPWQNRPSLIVSVDNPPSGGYNPQRPQYSTVLASWTPPDPASIQKLPTQIKSIDNPPSGGYNPQQSQYSTVLASWTPPDQATWISKPPSGFGPFGTAVAISPPWPSPRQVIIF